MSLLIQSAVIFLAGGAFEQHRPGQGELSIQSQPTGAEISIDDVFYGTTPLKLNLTPGVHRFKATKDGYRPETKAVAVRLGVSLDLTLVLDKAGCTATISSSPLGANVYLGDVFYGTTPTTINGLADGTYRLTLKRTGYKDWKNSFTIRGANTVSINAPLQKPAPPPAPPPRPSPSMPSILTEPTSGLKFADQRRLLPDGKHLQWRYQRFKTGPRGLPGLLDHGLMATLRTSRGGDIDAACGQLAADRQTGSDSGLKTSCIGRGIRNEIAPGTGQTETQPLK